MNDDAYHATGRQGLTAAQRNFARTLPESNQDAFEGMSKVEREAVMAGIEPPETPNKEREKLNSQLEARVKALEDGKNLTAGKGIDIQGTRISLKGREDGMGGGGGGLEGGRFTQMDATWNGVLGSVEVITRNGFVT